MLYNIERDKIIVFKQSFFNVIYRFMCELLKVNILVPPILEMCLAKLIQCPKELSLECVCIILQHAGSAIDHVRFTKLANLIISIVQFDI